MLVDQIVDLVTRYITNPGKPAWRSKWAQMYNRNREPRYAIHIMHVASYQPQMDTALGTCRPRTLSSPRASIGWRPR